MSCASGCAAANALRSAASSLQPEHQDAQTLITTGLPANAARLTSLPVTGSVPERSGASRELEATTGSAVDRVDRLPIASTVPVTATAATATTAARIPRRRRL